MPVISDPNLYTVKEDYTLTASFADVGSPINMKSFNSLQLFVDYTTNDSSGEEIKLVGMAEPGGQEYEIDGFSNISLSGTDTAKTYNYDIHALPYIQVKAKAGTVGTTPGSLTISVMKQWEG